MTDVTPTSTSAPLIAPAPAFAVPGSREVMTIDVNDPARFLNRDIEWLEFNARVLDIAADARTPLLERLRFLSIYSANLDEFFMKRVGVLKRQIEAGVSGPVPEALTPVQQLDGIRARVATLAHRQAMSERCHPGTNSVKLLHRRERLGDRAGDAGFNLPLQDADALHKEFVEIC